MPKYKNMVGKNFGRLKILERAKNDKHGNAMWLCVCICGNTVTVRGGSLRNSTESCGCLTREVAKKLSAGKNNHMWAGNNVNYDAAHRWLTKNKPKPPVCEMCRERPPVELSFNHKVGNWTRNTEDYQWLCTSCHKLKDAGNEAKPLTIARIHRIREFYKAGAGTHKKLGELFKVSKATITKIINHKGVYANEGG